MSPVNALARERLRRTLYPSGRGQRYLEAAPSGPQRYSRTAGTAIDSARDAVALLSVSVMSLARFAVSRPPSWRCFNLASASALTPAKVLERIPCQYVCFLYRSLGMGCLLQEQLVWLICRKCHGLDLLIFGERRLDRSHIQFEKLSNAA